MPTSLPAFYPARPQAAANPPNRVLPVLLIWASVLLLLSLASNPGAETGTMDAFVLLSTF